MRDLLAPRHRSILARVVATRPLVAFDYDGTLAPIVTSSRAARMRQKTRRLLRELARHLPVVVISGRRRADLARRLRGVDVRAIVGNHGMEDTPRARPSPKIGAWRAALEARLRGEPGVIIEDKRFSLTIHFRRAPSWGLARAAVVAAASDLRGAQLIGGKAVVNVLPRGFRDKRDTLDTLRRRYRRRSAIYVGDDETDEPVFARSSRVLGIRVGRTRSSRARYFLPTQRHIDDFLQSLVHAAAAAGLPRWPA
jgi:trehalose 6-phosphate phosphatase